MAWFSWFGFVALLSWLGSHGLALVNLSLGFCGSALEARVLWLGVCGLALMAWLLWLGS